MLSKMTMMMSKMGGNFTSQLAFGKYALGMHVGSTRAFSQYGMDEFL
jgi:hypothetical protein